MAQIWERQIQIDAVLVEEPSRAVRWQVRIMVTETGQSFKVNGGTDMKVRLNRFRFIDQPTCGPMDASKQ